MRYTSIVLAALLASLTIAAPWGTYTAASTSKEIRVELSNSTTELESQTTFTEGGRQEKTLVTCTAPFLTINIRLSAHVQQKHLRCQALNKAGKPLVATRGANTDTTFADGGNGP